MPLPPLKVTLPPDGMISSYLRPHTTRPLRPTTKDTEIARITDQVDFEQGCVHRREELYQLILEAYEAGQRDPLPLPPGPYENRL